MPHQSGGVFHGIVTRYDTQAPFAATSSWSTFDVPARVNAEAKGFAGAAFDGRYVYLVPLYGGVAARFDAKTPPALPSSYRGSFL